MKRMSFLVIGVLALAAGCTSSGTSSESLTTGGSSVTDSGEGEAVGLSGIVVPGGVGQGKVTVDGTVIDVVTVAPEAFETGDEAPVLLAFPPGGQSIELTRSLVEQTYREEALARGWVVVSPAAPDGQLYFQGSELLVPGLLEWVDTWVQSEGGQIHLAGVSNGGLSTFRVAGQLPDQVSSVLTFPGYPSSDQDRAALEQLTGIPVRMFAGENDPSWVAPMQETEATLADLGGDVVLEVFPGEGHIIGALSDGVRIFDELDASR